MAHFTKQEVEEMRQRLATTAVKDTDLPEATKVSTEDYVAIVQGGVNKKVTIGYLYQELTFEEYTVRIYVLEGSTMLINRSTAHLVAHVYRNEEDITDRIAQNYFSWERTSRDHEADEMWNFLHAGIGNELEVTWIDVNRSCTFFCCVPTDYIKSIT